MSSPAEIKRWMRELQESRGWKLLLEYAEAQIKGRGEVVLLTPAKTVDELVAQEFPKGEISGIKLFLLMPETIESIAAAQAKARVDPNEVESANGPDEAN